jgi:hypothetical protein
MVEGHGLGMGGAPFHGHEPNHVLEMAWSLAERLDERKASWTIEPFSPTSGPGQVVRTTAELLDGAGTCLDFAVTLAAMCVRERIPCHLAIAEESGNSIRHAFIVIQVLGPGLPHEETSDAVAAGFDDWVELLAGPHAAHTQLIDVTPQPEETTESRLSVRERSERLLESLRSKSGYVFAIEVEAALQAGGSDGYYRLPESSRDLGITARLPDLPRDFAEFQTHQEVRERLKSANGLVVLQGPSGSGKSTLALERAIRTVGGKGWFLDGSDERTLRNSLADAEARSGGTRAMNLQADYLKSMTSAADRRLKATSRPWVVVIDNAEGEPSKLRELIPNAKKGQLVIVTTTREDWMAVVGEECLLRVKPLEDADLQEQTPGAGLPDGEWFPGLLRIVKKAGLSGELLRSLDGTIVERVVRGALGIVGTDWPNDPRTLTVVAASFMPAERITLGWLSESAFVGSRERAKAVVDDCAASGLFEKSRQSFDFRASDEEPIWMHRLVRKTVQTLLPAAFNELGWSVVARYGPRRRSNHYTDEELLQLCEFLSKSAPSAPSVEYGEAVQVVLDLLESRGIESVKRAAALANGAMTCVDPNASRKEGRIMSTMLVARARLVNQINEPPPDPKDVEEAIGWCEQAESLMTGSLSTEDLLQSGRASAMRGLLIKRLANLQKNATQAEKVELLNRALNVLIQSYQSRKQALEQEAIKKGHDLEDVEDPEQHIDRGWYNLGGANVDLANAIRKVEPNRVPALLSNALAAYAGSLDLRRRLDLPSDNTYAAASLWGIALIAYSAALYCPGELELTNVQPVDELDPVLRNQTRTSLLRAAELAGARALEMRVVVDSAMGGDTNKARDLLRKISLAWKVRGGDGFVRASEVLKALESLFNDLDVTSDDIEAAVAELGKDA